LISGISKKIIFVSFLFINFIQQSKSAELAKINKDINNRNIKLTSSNASNLDVSLNSKDISLSNNLDDFNDYGKFLKKKTDSLLIAKAILSG